MRLIDKKELKEWIESWFTKNKYYHPYSKSNSIPIDELYDILEQMPTIEAVSVGTLEQFIWERDIAIGQLNEIGKDLGSKMDDVITVVRCKDCKHSDGYNHCTRLSIWNKPDDYCSYGERREDENEQNKTYCEDNMA